MKEVARAVAPFFRGEVAALCEERGGGRRGC